MEEKSKLHSGKNTENNDKKKLSDVKLNELLADNENDSRILETPEEIASYEKLMADYRNLIGSNDSTDRDEEEITPADEREFLISLPRSKKERANKDAPKRVVNPEWDEEITLSPQEYYDPDIDGELIADELPEEEPMPNFDLGDDTPESDDEFQLTINFSGETNQETVEEPRKTKGYNPEKPRVIDWFYDFVEMIVFVLVAVVVLTTFVFKHAIVDGSSMNNTLQHGDHLIISNLFYTPDYGDIIVFEDAVKYPANKIVVKRVVGLPGDTVEVRLNENKEIVVYVNGKLIEESYAYNAKDAYAITTKPIVVGENEVFVIGDNRYHSTDSRIVGTVDIDSILGKALFRIFPFDQFGGIE